MFDENISYETVQGKGNAEDVTMFGFSHCDHCHNGLNYLKEKGIAHRYVFIDQEGQYDRIRVRSFFQSHGEEKDPLFPILFFNEDDFVRGFDPEKWEEKLKEKNLL